MVKSPDFEIRLAQANPGSALWKLHVFRILPNFSGSHPLHLYNGGNTST